MIEEVGKTELMIIFEALGSLVLNHFFCIFLKERLKNNILKKYSEASLNH